MAAIMKIQLSSDKKGGKRIRNANAFAKEYARLLGLDTVEHTVSIVIVPNFHNQGQLHFEGNSSILVLKEDRIDVMMQTLAHEMVHLKQFIKKELRHTKAGNLTWKGKRAKGAKWADRPWEIEAMQKEVILHYVAMENLQ